MDLVQPAAEHLASYADALRREWSPDTQRPALAAEELRRIEADPATFLAEQIDPHGGGRPVTLPDGSTVPRLPSYRLWMWDGEFCGSISLRWQPGTTALPPTCLGHVGYSVVPWKRGRGYATRALGLLLPLARQQGLPFVELTTDLANLPSQKVILHNGGELVERFQKPAAHGGAFALRFRIHLGNEAET
jgi:predicted acetyltransferase